MKASYEFKARVWLYPGPPAGGGSWHFITVPKKESEEIKKRFGQNRRGFGSLPVVVKIGKTSWKTSIFPHSKVGAYLFPLKAEIRRKEGIALDDVVSLTMEIRSV